MSNLEHALALAREGFCVFPVRHVLPDGSCSCSKCADCRTLGKHPRLMSWQQRATTDEETIKTWWCAPDAQPAFDGQHWECDPDSSIGVVPQDGLVVVDIDPRNGGLDTAAELEASDGGLPTTRTIATSNGGCHLYYRTPAGMKYPGLAGPGVDIKGPGGFVLGPPSIHKSGARYVVEVDAPIADAPAWLIALGTPRKERTLGVRKPTEGGDDALSEAAQVEADAVIALLEPAYVEGSKHAIATAFGAYCKANGKSEAFTEYVIGMLPSTDPETRVQSALTFYGYRDTSGWRKLEQHLPSATLKALETTIKAKRAGAYKSQYTREQAQVLRASAHSVLKPRKAGEPPPTSVELEQDSHPYEIIDPNVEPEEPEYTVLTFCPGKTSAITAYANTSKTPFALLLGISVAMGVNFLGQKTKQAKVLYLAFEGAGNARRKAQRICRGLGTSLAALSDVFIIGKSDAGALDSTYITALERDCLKNRIDCVIIDTYGHALDSSIERNSSEFSSCLKHMGSISETHGILWINLLHHRKSAKGQRGGIEMVDGHNSIAGALQSAVTLHRPDDGDQYTFEATCSRALDTPFQDFAFKWVDTTEGGEDLTPERAFAERVSGKLGLKASLVTLEQEVDKIEAELLTLMRAIQALLEKKAKVGQLQVPRTEIIASVAGMAEHKKKEALAFMVERGMLTLSVEGVRHLYSLKVKA